LFIVPEILLPGRCDVYYVILRSLTRLLAEKQFFTLQMAWGGAQIDHPVTAT
jgi:hypothetical protein